MWEADQRPSSWFMEVLKVFMSTVVMIRCAWQDGNLCRQATLPFTAGAWTREDNPLIQSKSNIEKGLMNDARVANRRLYSFCSER